MEGDLYPDPWIARVETTAFPLVKEKGRWQGEIIGRGKDGRSIPTDVSLVLCQEHDRLGEWRNQDRILADAIASRALAVSLS